MALNLIIINVYNPPTTSNATNIQMGLIPPFVGPNKGNGVHLDCLTVSATIPNNPPTMAKAQIFLTNNGSVRDLYARMRRGKVKWSFSPLDASMS